MKEKVLITAALPYANGPLHFGHIAGAYLPGDCYARFARLLGKDVLYICGSDEYGVAVTYSAKLAKRTPKEQVDHFHAINRDFFQKLAISFDHYSRTTWDGHAKVVQEFFLRLLEKGHIEEKVTDQLYSKEDDQFLADRYVVGTCPKCKHAEARGDECPKCGASFDAIDLKNPRSKLTGSTLERRPTKHWFLRFDHFKKELSAWIEEKPWKSNVVNFAKHYIDDLRERPITRDSDWGVPVPLDGAEGKVLYVWFDAPIGYISASMEWAQKTKDPKAWESFWLDTKTKYVQFIGKDNIPFHAIFFPAMIMGQDKPFKLVDDLPANEFLNLEGKQFSKTAGWTIDLERFFTQFTSDQIRYCLAANAPETSDSEFSWKDFQMRSNSELLGKFGNFANRVLTFTRKHFGDAIPPCTKKDSVFRAEVQKHVQAAKEAYESYSLRKATSIIMELASVGNVYFDAKQPWKAIKEGDKDEVAAMMYHCIECLQALALISYPIIPDTSQKLWTLLGNAKPLGSWEIPHLKENTPLPTPEILFKRVEDDLIEKELEILKKKVESDKSISFKEFEKLDLRVAKILSAEPVPKSDKLLKISVDLGSEKRTIVSGIAKSFPHHDKLIGKNVIVIANLKPAKLMGIESQGMILAAGEKDLELPFLEKSAPGDPVK